MQGYDFSLVELVVELNRDKVRNDRQLPVPHAPACPQGTEPTASSPLAPSARGERAKWVKNVCKSPAGIRREPEPPEPVSASSGWGCLERKSELQVSERPALAGGGRGC